MLITTLIILSLQTSSPVAKDFEKDCVLPVCQKDAIISAYKRAELDKVSVRLGKRRLKLLPTPCNSSFDLSVINFSKQYTSGFV